MEKSLGGPAPYFDGIALRHELTAIFQAHSSRAGDARPAVLERLKTLVKECRALARQQLDADENGRRCAEGLSHFQDELIRLVYDYTTVHAYRADNPSVGERMAIVATGGYGRGLLAPGSDIDLLFLLPYKQTPWGESVVEYVLYLLWDLGFKVGHATRTIDQCLKLSLADVTIRTSLLDTRLILGNEALYDDLVGRFRSEVVKGTTREFIEAKLAERDSRHRRSGESRYRLEPNIKDGKGGLRDLHTLHWLACYIFDSGPGRSAVEASIFSQEEISTYRKCENFLWTVRCQLHFMTGRAEERLSFDVQPVMAEKLGYVRRGGLRAVERFMKHYFLIAKDVGDLTRILCSALEVQQLRAAPGLNMLLSPQTWRMRRQLRRTTDFRIDNGRITVAASDVFKRDPLNLLRLFAHAERYNALLHPEAIRLLRRSLRAITDEVRAEPEANRIFLELLTSSARPDITLRSMNETGLLGRFIPEFGHVVAMMQFNMYHHYTVDEHLIRTVGVLSEIEKGDAAELHPLSTELIKTLRHRRALYVAAFLHDIGKGRAEDHSILGARIARQLCPRLGLPANETETIAWLVEQHLAMSMFAQSRDLNDPKTIRDFADIVQSPERLKLLFILTVADIRAVGPGTWNGWKGQLLRTLYYEAERLVSGGHTGVPQRQRIAAAEQALGEALSDWSKADIEVYLARHYPDYWLKTDAAKQVEHARLVAATERSGRIVATHFQTDSFTAVTELTVVAPNHPRLLSLFAGACAAAGANIVGAHISTTRDGLALDTFLLQRAFERDEDERRRSDRIARSIEKLLQGEERLADLMARRRDPEASRLEAFTVEPEVLIDNTLSEELTVIEVSGRDRPGLLYDLTNSLSDLNLDIRSAHVTTFGEKVVDVFYVTDLIGKKIVAATRETQIRSELLKILDPNGSARAAAAPETAG
ncbi:MAG: [protein-PII] uridylyltransferase [Hyphomicrobiaceae bacterium]